MSKGVSISKAGCTIYGRCHRCGGQESRELSLVFSAKVLIYTLSPAFSNLQVSVYSVVLFPYLFLSCTVEEACWISGRTFAAL